MTSVGTFPFGQPVLKVVQTDRTHKRVFVLGVYASAVHARWIGADHKTKVTALAVASEPYIFWRGGSNEEVQSFLDRVAIPINLGKLVPADKRFNGLSGRALDDCILTPLGLTRTDTWLCDLVPHSCMNDHQAAAIEREYKDAAQKHSLPVATVPPKPKELADDKRREQILAEIQESGASVLILLGDEPIRWFLSQNDRHWRRLYDFGKELQTYGRLHDVQIGGQNMQVLPLAHPRQIAKIGLSSDKWYDLHQGWIDGVASNVLNR